MTSRCFSQAGEAERSPPTRYVMHLFHLRCFSFLIKDSEIPGVGRRPEKKKSTRDRPGRQESSLAGRKRASPPERIIA